MTTRSIFPPRYLSHRPPDLWFWEEFGPDYDQAQTLWLLRYQLVKVSEAQNWRCCYCGRRADPPLKGYPQLWEATRERVIPRSRGGGEDDDNIVMACAACNHRRSSHDAYTFRPRPAR